MFDMIARLVISLVMLGTIIYVGVAVMAQTGSLIDLTGIVNAAVAWFPVVAIAILGVMIIALTVSIFGSDASRPAPARAPVRAPAPEPTVADLIARDPEIVALRGSITETDEELARIRAERRQQLDGHGQLGRALLWFRRRFHRESAT